MIPKHIKGNTYSLTIGYADIGIYISGDRAVLIDTGSEPSALLFDFLEEEKLTVPAIINTHLHVDHIANNDALHEMYGTKVYASEAEITHQNDGGYELGDYVNANPSKGILTLCGSDFEIISSPGHSEGHQFVVTPDGVCFAGDAVISPDVLADLKMPYEFDIDKALDSMRLLRSLDYEYFALSHKGVYSAEEIRNITDENIGKESHLQSVLAGLVKDRIKEETLVDLLLDRLNVTFEKRQIFWVRDTAKARISCLDNKLRKKIRP